MPTKPDSSGPSGVNIPPAELLLSAIVDSTDDAIVSKSLDGVITTWNKSAERIFGYTATEAIGQPISLLIPKDRLAEADEILQRIKNGERIDRFETSRQHKTGRLVDVSVTISPIRTADGKIVGASKVARDITEQKRADEISVLLAAIVNSSDDAIVSKNLDGIITSWNDGAQRIFGYTREEAVGRPVLMLIPPDRKDEELDILARIRRGERVEHFETVRVRKNGEQFPVSLTISPVKNSSGQVVGASKIARDITYLKQVRAERDQLLASERAARMEAEHASRMKDEFLATVSHELRTPLNAIVGWTQVLRESAEHPQEITQGLDVIERNAFAQAHLIDDLLDLGRIATGKMPLEMQAVEINAIVRDAIASVQPTADLKGIRIKTTLDHRDGPMLGDKRRLQQVVWNLLSNAIKFTPKNGQVTVTVSRIGSQMEIVVADNGRGIAAEFMPHLFERFRQADSTTTRQYGGLGIGLALVKQLVELHGGTVRAESPGLGQGATFAISLPVPAAQSERLAPARAPSAGEAARVAEDLAGISVLVVDDDKDSLEVIERILASRRARVATAASVEDALAAFASFHPDVILSDIGMPGHDGYELIRRIRQLPDGAFVPAAALTALARPDDRMRALQAGFQTHVAKPTVATELIAIVRSLAALHPPREELGAAFAKPMARQE